MTRVFGYLGGLLPGDDDSVIEMPHQDAEPNKDLARLMMGLPPEEEEDATNVLSEALRDQGWSEQVDNGVIYYYNEFSGESKWDMPTVEEYTYVDSSEAIPEGFNSPYAALMKKEMSS